MEGQKRFEVGLRGEGTQLDGFSSGMLDLWVKTSVCNLSGQDTILSYEDARTVRAAPKEAGFFKKPGFLPSNSFATAA